MSDIRIGLVGAGLIGRTHVETIRGTPGFRLAGIVDPAPQGAEMARSLDVPLHASIEDLVASRGADGVIVATPTDLHVPISVGLLEAGLPVLLEKPIAETVDKAMTVLDVEARTGVPLLVGHHRRHNPIVRAARKAISEGAIGELVTASVLCTLYKPDGYFEIAWHRRPAVGGPLLINLIHEIDLMRHLFGDVASVSAISSNAVRRLDVEDTAAAILRFANGGMATMTVTDAAVGPWAWDLSAGENPGRFPAHPIQSHFFAGSEGGLTLPDLVHWTHDGEKNWTKAIGSRRLPVEHEDSYRAQLRHFGALIVGEAAPVVSGLEATKNLATIEAIGEAAASGSETRVRLVRPGT
jgi:predicted dehydrogenase